MPKLVFYQYQGKDPVFLKAWVKKNRAVLVDTRRKVRSHDTRWSKDAMLATLGNRYVHLPRLGADDCPPEREQALNQILEKNHVVLIGSMEMAEALQEYAAARSPETEEGTTLPPIDPPDAKPDILDVQEAAEFLGISYDTVRYHIYVSGHLQRYGRKVGRDWVFTTASLKKYKEQVHALFD